MCHALRVNATWQCLRPCYSMVASYYTQPIHLTTAGLQLQRAEMEHSGQTACMPGMQVCPSTGRPCDCTDGMQVDSSESKQALADLKPEKPSMEPIFPAELRKRQPSELHLHGALTDWHRSALLRLPCNACFCAQVVF